MKYTSDIVATVMSMKGAGYSNREIARKILGKESKESSVRRILERGAPTNQEGNPAKILIMDIETAPCMSYHWRRFKEFISQDQAIKESYVLTWAAKWLDSPDIMSDALPNHSLYRDDPENDVEVVSSLAELMDQADLVVAHNGKYFDIPVWKTRMLLHGLPPVNPFHVVDTCAIAKKEFRFPSNSLASLGAYLGLGAKVDHEGFNLWKKVVHGDMEAWDRMMEYNIGDITLLEDVYLALRPWDSKHPNVGIYGSLDEVCCPCCGSTDVVETGKYSTTHVSKFPAIQCNSCGAVKSTRFTVLDKEQRRNILRNVR